MKKKITLLIFIILITSSYSQIILNANLGSVPNPCGQTLYDSGGSGGNYQNNENYTATFCAPAGQYLTINFTAFNIENGWDYLYVYNGNSTASPLLGTFSGATLPGSFTSTQGGCITIVFTTDGSVTYSGFAASISCSSVAPPPPPPQILLNGNLGTNSNACGYMFYDSGGPTGNYTNSQNYSVTLCAPAGQILTINFSAFNLESNFDYLYIYNGNSTAAPLVGQYSGSALPPSFSTPAGGCVTIKFTSDGSVVYAGWTASISCVSVVPPPPPPPGNTFSYTGSMQTWTVPPCVNNVTITARGAQGGSNAQNLAGGLGGSATGVLAVTPGQVLNIFVGGTNGYNGGGNVTPSGCATALAGKGGGASDVRIGGVALANRIIVAGGGGGAGGNRVVSCGRGTGGGGGGGYYGGGGGAGWPYTSATLPTGGTQVAGGIGGTSSWSATYNGFPGVLGVGGNGGTEVTSAQAGSALAQTGGAGGGLVGGNGLYVNNWTGQSGAGGSSFVGGVTAGVTSSGINSGNGLVIISFTASASGTISAVANPTVVCSGKTSTINLSGGLTYTTNPGNIVGSSFTVSPFVTNTYSVTASLVGGCNTATATVTVAVNPLPVVLPGSNSPVCPGSTLNLTSSAATSYTWTGPNGFISNLQNPAITNVTNAMGGVYTLSVTNASGCVNSATTNVTVNPPPTITINTPTNAICNGNTTNLFANGAVNYTWNPGSLIGSAVTISPSVTTIYTLTGANAAGCSSTNTVLITVNPLPTITAVLSPTAICFGNNASVLYSGAFTYTTNNGNLVGSALSLSPSSSTTYTVSGTSALGCLNTNTFVIVVNPLPLIAVNNPTTCLNSTFTLTASGGTAYAWSGPNGYTSNQQNPVISNALLNMTGNYTVLVTNIFGCTNTAVSSVSVVSLPPVSIVGTSTLCSNNYNGSPALANLTASGATSYTWTLPIGYFGNPNLNSSNISVVPINTSVQSVETVTLVGELGTCTNSAVFTLTVVPNPTISVTSGSMCAGTSLVLNASGANTYTWSPSLGLNTTNGSQVIASPNNTTIYNVIGGTAGCNSQTETGTATVVPNPTVVISPPQPFICFGENITLTANGATDYTWTPNTALSSINTSVTIANPTTTTTYSVLGSQATCTNLAFTTLTVIALPVLTVTPSSPTLCMNNYNGSPNSVTITANGANTYTWGPINGLIPNTLNGSTIIGVSDGSSIGTGTVIGTVGTCSNTATFTVNAVPNPTISVSSGSMCAGTSVVLNANGASTYTWSPSLGLNTTNGSQVIASPNNTTIYNVIGSTAGCNSQTETGTATVVPNPTVVITPANPIICFGETISLTANGATDYTWTPNTALSTTNTSVTSANPTITTTYNILGSQATCTNLASVTVTVLPLPVVTIASSSPTLCMNNYNGSPNTVTFTASGAATYTWGPINGLTSNTLNGSTIIGTSSNGALNGIVTVVGSVGNCTNTATFTVNAVANPTISVTSGSMCAGTSVVLNANGANTYTWSPSLGLNTTNGPQVIANPNNTTIYNVIGSTAGCNSQTETGTATVVPNPTVVITPANPIICFGETISLTANGATDYTWTPNTALSTTNTSVTSANPTITTTYNILGSQATCTNLASVTVTVLPLPVVTIASSSPTLCMNNYNGSPNTVTFTASGAATYTWGPINGLTANTLNGSTIIGTSSNGALNGIVTVVGSVGNCTNVATFTVNAVANPTISVTSGSMCAGTSVVLNANGANTYTWSPSNALNVVNGPQVIANPLGTSIYNVIGSTAGCNSQTQSGTATVVPNPTVVITPANPIICFGKNISLTAVGATDYTWTPSIGLSSPNSANTIANPTITTTYNILGSQATCTNLASVTVTVLALPVVNITSSSPTLCMNNYNGSPNNVTLTASGANTYTWGPISGLMPNTLNGSVIIGTSSNGSAVGTVTVTGTVGTCSNTATFTVNAVPNPTISVSSGSMCAGTSVVLNASGANSYTWSPSTALNTTSGPQVTANPSITTVYNVIGSTAGCNSQTQVGLANVVPNPTITISPVNPYICFGSSVPLTVSGATTYTWLPNTALSSTSAINVTANPTVTTTYTVIGSQATCTNTAINTVTVLPLPVPTITSSAQACVYTPVNLQTSPGYSVYQWSGPLGYSSNVSNATFTSNTTAQTGTYNLSVTDAFGCIGTASTSIIINPLPAGILARDDKNSCVPFCAIFKVNATGSPIVNTVWQVNNQTVFTPTLSYCLNKAGSYTVGTLFSDANGCSNTATFTIKAYESPIANFIYSPINPIEGIEPISFTNTSTGNGNVSWNWYFINNNGYISSQPNTSYLFEQAGNYPVALVVKNKLGCSDTIIQVINVAEDHSLYVPNAFTPNYDGRNDVFLPKGRGISKYNLMIFDRWGQKLFESNEFTEGWDGTFGGVECKNDVYVWKIIASFSNAKPKEYTGQVMLIK